MLFIPRLQLMEEDTIKEVEQAEEKELRDTMEGLQELEDEWEQRKRNEKRKSMVQGAEGVQNKGAVKRGARGRKQGGRPSKTRKFDLIEDNWGVKTTKDLEDDLEK